MIGSLPEGRAHPGLSLPSAPRARSHRVPTAPTYAKPTPPFDALLDRSDEPRAAAAPGLIQGAGPHRGQANSGGERALPTSSDYKITGIIDSLPKGLPHPGLSLPPVSQAGSHQVPPPLMIASPTAPFDALADRSDEQEATAQPTQSFGALGVFGRFGAAQLGDGHAPASWRALAPDGMPPVTLIGGSTALDERDGRAAPVVTVPDPAGMMGPVLPALASLRPVRAVQDAPVTSLPNPLASPLSEETEVDAPATQSAATPRQGRWAATPDPQPTAVSLTVSEQAGSLQVVARGGEDGIEGRAKLRSLLADVAAEFGFSIHDVRLNGQPVPDHAFEQGVSHGRRAS